MEKATPDDGGGGMDALDGLIASEKACELINLAVRFPVPSE